MSSASPRCRVDVGSASERLVEHHQVALLRREKQCLVGLLPLCRVRRRDRLGRNNHVGVALAAEHDHAGSGDIDDHTLAASRAFEHYVAGSDNNF